MRTSRSGDCANVKDCIRKFSYQFPDLQCENVNIAYYIHAFDYYSVKQCNPIIIFFSFPFLLQDYQEYTNNTILSKFDINDFVYLMKVFLS